DALRQGGRQLCLGQRPAARLRPRPGRPRHPADGALAIRQGAALGRPGGGPLLAADGGGGGGTETGVPEVSRLFVGRISTPSPLSGGMEKPSYGDRAIPVAAPPARPLWWKWLPLPRPAAGDPMPPHPPTPSPNKAPAAPPRQPPEEKFWQHYSPHHEFPL